MWFWGWVIGTLVVIVIFVVVVDRRRGSAGASRTWDGAGSLTRPDVMTEGDPMTGGTWVTRGRGGRGPSH